MNNILTEIIKINLLNKEVNVKVLWNIIIEGMIFNGIKYMIIILVSLIIQQMVLLCRITIVKVY